MVKAITNPPAKPPQKPKRARITRQDVEQIAKLVALRFSERMACIKLDVPYKQWLKWKERSKSVGEYDAILTRMKADKCANMLESIEDAALGRNKVRHDWRAAREMLTIVDREAYGDKEGQQPTQQVSITIDRLQVINQLVQDDLARERQLPVIEQPKAVTDTPADAH